MSAAQPPQATVVQADTISSHSQAIGAVYSALIGGSTPVPPKELVLVPMSILRQYDEMIHKLESRSKRDREMLTELLQGREELVEPENTLGQLSPQATAVVNSLLASVPRSNFYQDEVEEL